MSKKNIGKKHIYIKPYIKNIYKNISQKENIAIKTYPKKKILPSKHIPKRKYYHQNCSQKGNIAIKTHPKKENLLSKSVQKRKF